MFFLLRQSLKLASQPRAICLAPANEVAVVACLKHLYLFPMGASAACSPVATVEVPAEVTTGCISTSGNLVAVGKAVSYFTHTSFSS